MKFSAAFLSASAALLGLTTADDLHYAGFTTYKQLYEGVDNSGQLPYSNQPLSQTLYVNVQIWNNGSNHAKVFNDFNTLCSNWGKNNVTLIPRLVYGYPNNNSISSEPVNLTLIQTDLKLWTNVLTTIISNQAPCKIPLVQAGMLGQYGEWHDGPYCNATGQSSSSTQMSIKRQIVKSILGAGTMAAVRNPMDHKMIAQVLTSDQLDSFTMHDDCILSNGPAPNGDDTGTFVAAEGWTATQWRNYTLNYASFNAFGGEGCPGTYNWDDTATVCSTTNANSLPTYIRKMGISYLNPLWPPQMAWLYGNTSNATAVQCIKNIQAALQANT